MDSINCASGVMFTRNNKLYIKHKLTDTHTYYKCRDNACNSYISYKTDTNTFNIITPHTCSTGQDSVDTVRLLASFDRRAKHGEAASTLANEIVQTASQNLSLLLPTRCALVQRFKRLKRKRIPPLPRTLHELALNGEWIVTIRNTRFLLSDSWLGDNRIVIFASHCDLEHLCTSQMVLSDGTFYSCPPQFQQIYTFHSFNAGVVCPRVYAFLTSKSAALYRHLIRLIRDFVNDNLPGYNFSPPNFMCDFERAMITTLENEFPQAEIHGCYFHFCNSILRFVRLSGL